MQDRLTLPIITSLNRASVAVYQPGAAFGPRNMRDWEFVWMIEGDAIYRWNDTEVKAPEGSIVLCRPGAVDSFIWDPNRRTRHGFFHFDLKGIPSDWPAPRTWQLVRTPNEGDLLRPAFRYVMTWARQGLQPLVQLTIVQMLAAFVYGQYDCTGIPREAMPAAVELAMRCIYNALDDNAAKAISLCQLAKAAEVTPEHLCRLFRSATGRSPAETVRLARLDRAVILLSRSNYSIGEIAKMCGFKSQFHFSRRFSQAYGTPPKNLRQRMDAGMVPPVLLQSRWDPG